MALPVATTQLTPLAELEPMVSRAGLTLNAGQMADLALAWRQITELLGRIPRDATLLDNQAYVFRVAPPVAQQMKLPGKPAARNAAGRTTARKAPARKG